MKKTNQWIGRNGKKLLGVALSMAAALTGADAFAQSGGGDGSGAAANGMFTMKVAPGISRRQTLKVLPSGQVRATQNLGVGNEHARVDVVGDTVVMLYSSSNVSQQNGPSQLKCTAIKMNPTGVPTVVADQVALTWTNADRFAHPSLSCETTGANAGKCLFAYGANNVNGNGNTQTYAGVLDTTCKDLTGFKNHVVLNANPNNNEAAPNSIFDGTKHVFQYYANNDGVYAELVSIVSDGNGGLKPKLISKAQKTIDSNIGHGTILVLPGKNRALYADCAGQNRPCPKGNMVYMLNTDETALNANKQMAVMWKATLLKAEPDPNNIGGVDGLPGPLGGKGVYPASPQLVLGDNGEVHMVSFISDGAGHNRNKKGSSTNHILTMVPDDTGPNVKTQTAGLALESNHLGACSAQVGVVGSEQRVAAVFGSPPTGFGAASLSYIFHDATAAKHMLVGSAAVSPSDADGGYLNNMLGRNPATQGRNHLFCLGDVPNPGYGVTGGFMPHVKTFILTPWTGRVAMDPTKAPLIASAEGKMVPEDRNAQFLTFVAGVRDAQQVPPPSAPPAGPQIPGASDNGNSTGTPGTPGDPGTTGTTGSFSSGCAMGGEGSNASALAMLLILASLALVARRRWS